MNRDAEECLKDTILPELEAGRPFWDKPHTESVVSYMKEILAHAGGEGLDADVLIAAAYAHDWGYSGLFKGGQPATYDTVQDQKTMHMQIGAQKITQLLQLDQFDYLNAERKQRIAHLVAVHDKLNELRDPDELVLMEADTLGALDVSKVKPTYNAEEDKTYRRVTLEKRVPKFITDYSKSKVKELVSLRERYFESK